MRKYIVLNEKGYPIFPIYFEGDSNIPKEAVEITEEEEVEYLSNRYFNKESGMFEDIPIELTLDELKTIKFKEVKEDYLKALYAVAWVDQNGSLYGYDTDPGSQLDFSLSHARAKLKGSTRYNVYTDKSNLETKEFLKHTPEMFDKVLTEVGNLQEGIFTKYYAVKALVKAAKTPEELAGISFDMEVPVDGQ